MAITTVELGKVLITHKGVWVGGGSYEKLDVVTENDSSYLCILDAASGILLTNTTYWRPLALGAYDYAVSAGYTGTAEQFAADLEDVSTKLSTDNIANNLTTEAEGKVLDARQGKALNDTKVDKVTGERLINAAEIIKLSNTSNTNSGDETQATIKTKLGAATAAVDGYLKKEDFSTFNGKQAALGYTAENAASKKSTITNSETDYPNGKAAYDALALKVDNVTGKALSTNDYNNTEKAAVANSVQKTGNETVAGIKTFSSSPIIPAPITDLQASTKKYVDDGLALKIPTSAVKQVLGTSLTSIISQAGITQALMDIWETGWYGVQWNTTVSTTPMTRTGNLQMHRTLPIQNKMKGCLVSDAGVVTYLPNTWTDGTLDGSAGQVMVEIPQHYRYFPAAVGTVFECRISEYPLPGYEFVPKSYISAYEATVASTTSKLSSVVNATAEYRGGNNSPTNDANPNTFLGKPATSISRANFRIYARNRGTGWVMMDYKSYNNMFWLYFVEYANTNSQVAVNAALDVNGYKQGGLGVGVTGAVGEAWGTFNGYYPFVNCGASNALGNGTGEVATTIPFATPISVKVNRYRGIELPFGHIWKNYDGIIFDIKKDADGGTSKAYICNTPANYSDVSIANYSFLGDMQRSSGYVKTLQQGSFIPLVAAGADSATYWSDYYYQSVVTTEFKTLLLGGDALSGAEAGLGLSSAEHSVSAAFSGVGSRLCFYP